MLFISIYHISSHSLLAHLCHLTTQSPAYFRYIHLHYLCIIHKNICCRTDTRSLQCILLLYSIIITL
jgi:hypothetical protein